MDYTRTVNRADDSNGHLAAALVNERSPLFMVNKEKDTGSFLN